MTAQTELLALAVTQKVLRHVESVDALNKDMSLVNMAKAVKSMAELAAAWEAYLKVIHPNWEWAKREAELQAASKASRPAPGRS